MDDPGWASGSVFNFTEHYQDSVQHKIIYDKMKMDQRLAVMRYQMDFVTSSENNAHSLARWNRSTREKCYRESWAPGSRKKDEVNLDVLEGRKEINKESRNRPYRGSAVRKLKRASWDVKLPNKTRHRVWENKPQTACICLLRKVFEKNYMSWLETG